MSSPDVLLFECWRALREAWRRPGYWLLASLTLALGVAATSAAFSLLDLAVLRRLPFPAPEQLVTLGVQQAGDVTAAPLLYGPLRDLPDAESVSIVRQFVSPVNLAVGTEATVAQSLLADHRFLTTLAAPLRLGRNFTASEDLPGAVPVVVLSHDFWSRRLGSDPTILNRTLLIEGAPTRVVGVLSADFQWPSAFDCLIPLQLRSDNRDPAFNEYIVARLRSGVTSKAIGTQVNALVHSALSELRPELGEDTHQYLSTLRFGARPLEVLLANASGALLELLFGAAGCVLLIATLNLANLTIVRGLSRSHDHAVRAALGAPTARVALPALTEGMLVGITGSALGALLAWLSLRFLAAFVPPHWLRGAHAGLTAAGTLFAFGVGTCIAVLAAAVGVWSGRGQARLQELVSGGRSGWSRRARGLGRVLVVAQVSVAVTLLLGAALLSRQLLQLATVPMGFESRSILTFTLSPLMAVYQDIDAVEQQTQRILTRLQQIPGATAATATSNLPTGSQLNLPVSLGAAEEIIVTQFRPITASFMETFGLSMRRGRAFDGQDTASAEPVCIVSSAFVAQHLQGEALGQSVRLRFSESGHGIDMRLVGVVSDVRQFGPAEPAPPIVYVPLAQMPANVWSVLRKLLPLSYAVRVRGAPQAYEAQLRAAVHEIEPLQPLAEVRAMDAVVAATTAQQRLTLLLIGTFAASALLLAGVGLYAVMAVAVSARQHELGVRAALGAQPMDLLRTVLLESGVQLGCGLLIGLIVTLGASGAVRRLLFGLDPADPVAIAAVLAVLSAAGLLASLAPALRAARTHPLQVLRAQ